MFLIKKNRGSTLNPWLGSNLQGGGYFFGRITEILAAGGTPKSFHTPGEAFAYIGANYATQVGIMEVHETVETPEGIQFKKVPWP